MIDYMYWKYLCVWNYLLQYFPLTFGKQWHSPVKWLQSNFSWSVPFSSHAHFLHMLSTAFPYHPGLQNSQWSPEVFLRHFRHFPDLGSQFPTSCSSQLLLQSHALHWPPTTSGFPKKFSKQFWQLNPVVLWLQLIHSPVSALQVVAWLLHWQGSQLGKFQKPDLHSLHCRPIVCSWHLHWPVVSWQILSIAPTSWQSHSEKGGWCTSGETLQVSKKILPLQLGKPKYPGEHESHFSPL